MAVPWYHRGSEAGGSWFHSYQFVGYQSRANWSNLIWLRLGTLAVQKVFVRSKQVLDGYDDLPHQWSGIVPAAS